MTISGLVVVSLTVFCMIVAFSKYTRTMTHVRHIPVHQTIRYQQQLEQIR